MTSTLFASRKSVPEKLECMDFQELKQRWQYFLRVVKLWEMRKHIHDVKNMKLRDHNAKNSFT